MSKVFSFSDFKIIPELAPYSEFQLIKPKFDKLVNKWLKILGFDLTYPVEYVPNKHRNLQGNVVIGFRAVGEIECNSAYIHSGLATLEERLLANYLIDPSLTAEMCMLMGSHTSFKDDVAASEDEGADWPASLTEPDYKDISKKLREMEEYKDRVRGDQRNPDGSLKTPDEFIRQWESEGICFVQ